MPDLFATDIERLLRDSRDDIGYPPTPDIAGRAFARIQSPAPDRGHTVGLIAATPSQRPVSQEAMRPIQLGAGRTSLSGQLVRLAAAILAFVVVGGLLIALFGLTGGDDDDRQAVPASGTVIQDRLYVLTNIPDREDDRAYGKFTAYDAETREEVYSLDVAYASQVAFSPDGSRIYLMTQDEDGYDGVIAVRAEDGSLIWRAPQLGFVVGYMSGGPPSMSISSDGSRLYLYNSQRDDNGTFAGYSVRTIDAETGATIGEVETSNDTNSGCTPQMHATPSNGRIFLTCWTGYRLRIFDLGMGRFTYDIDLPVRDTTGSELQSTDSIIGAVQSPDGYTLYVVSDGPRINVVNLGPGELEETHDLAIGGTAPVHRGLLALPEDGTRLAIGIQTVGHDNGLHDVGRIVVVDTTTWEIVTDISLNPALRDPPMTGHSMTFSPDGTALYISATEYETGTVNVVKSSYVTKLEIATGAREVVVEATGAREQIWRIFSGRLSVSQSPDPAQPDGSWTPPLLRIEDEPGRGLGAQIRAVDPVTRQNLPDMEPIPIGANREHAFSPDGRMLAAITWPNQNREGGALRIINLETWTATVAPVTDIGRARYLLFANDGQAVYWIVGDYVVGEFVLWRYDLASETASIVTPFPSQLAPWDVRLLDDNRLAVYGVPTDSGNLNAGDPRVIVVNFDDGTIAADVVLEGIKAGQYREDVSRTYRPGLAWDTERGLLYVVHADDDVITLVDLNRGVIVETTAYAPRQSRTDRLLGWLIPTAAKGGPWTGRQVILSEDGARLFIAPASDQNNWWRENLSQFPLQVIDTSDLSESRELDLPAISDMRLSPDGRLLVLQTYVHATGNDGQPVKTDQQIVALTVDGLREDGTVELSGEGGSLRPTTNYEISGFAADSRSLFAIRRASVDDTQSVELLVIDLDTWTTTVARTLDDSWYGELVVPQH